MCAQIAYIDGFRLRRSLIAGAHWVIERRRHLDDINVFPVPDGDTGTNMAATLRDIAEAVHTSLDHSVAHVSAVMADSALMGARGNSGAILAQFFYGLSDALQGRDRVAMEGFSAAATRAAALSYEAVAKPIEGTILTVIRAWAHEVAEAGRTSPDFVQVLQRSLLRAREALAQTTQQMQSLRVAGVVDAGAQGFVYLLEGIMHLVERGRSVEEAAESALPARHRLPSAHRHAARLEDPAYRFCTECVVRGPDLHKQTVRDALSFYGDSVVLAGSLKALHVHIHTDDPAGVFARLSEFGRVDHEKADDLRQQVRDLRRDTHRAVAVVTDTGCDLPSDLVERYGIHRVPFAIRFGDTEYLDRVTLSPDAFYRLLRESPHHPKTSQPAPRDFQRVYELIGQSYQGAVSIHVPRRLSGTLQAAERAVRSAAVPIRTIDSRSFSIGIGLIVLEAARAADEGLDLDGVVRRAEDAADRLTVIFSLETLEFLVRGGRVGKMKGLVGKMMRVRPILTTEKDGTLKPIAKAIAGQDVREVTLRIVEKRAAGLLNPRFAVAHAEAPETASWYADRIRARFSPSELIVTEVSAALGVHSGPGAVGIAFLGDSP